MKPEAAAHFPILGVDPGETTGLAYLVWDKETGELHWDTWSLRWPRDAGLLKDLVNDAKSLSVEAFRLFKDKAEDLVGHDFPSSRVIGYIEGLLQTDYKGKNFLSYGSNIKGQITDAFLKDFLGTDKLPGNKWDDHERDALRHAVVYLLKLLR